MRPSESVLPSLETAALLSNQGNKQASSAMDGRWSINKLQWVASKTTAVFRTVPTLLAYGVVHILMRIAPDAQKYRQKTGVGSLEASELRVVRRRYGYKLVRYFVCSYRRSF